MRDVLSKAASARSLGLEEAGEVGIAVRKATPPPAARRPTPPPQSQVPASAPPVASKRGREATPEEGVGRLWC